MKNWRAYFVLSFLLAVAAAMLTFQAPVSAQQGIGGPIARDMWVPSAFRFFFGDVTTSDIYLQKNGANVLGMSGAMGGLGTTANTTTSPAGPFDWGSVALSGGAATVTFSKPFTNAPICIATDATAANAVRVNPTATTLALTGTTTDTIDYACFGNPN